jgi:5-methylcytosine-specific restriction endonuclease McrA
MEYLDKYNFSDNWMRKARKCNKENVQSLISIKKQLVTKYLTYDSLIINYQNRLMTSTFLTNKELLLDFYKSAPTKLAYEFKRRREYNDLLECPYCGKPNTPNTIDHFIPKDEWPEFAIYPKNLVPQCRDCMPIKGQTYYCATNSIAKYIHPIFFNYLSKIKFEIEISFCTTSNTIRNYEIKIIHPSNFTHLNRVKLHLKNLNVKKRIIIYCNKEFKKWEKLRRKKQFSITRALKVELKKIHNDDVGKNWETAFYKALLGNEDCINYFNSLNINPTTRTQTTTIEVSSDFE